MWPCSIATRLVSNPSREMDVAATTYRGDLTDVVHVKAAIAEVIKKLGHLDGLVNSHDVTLVEDNRFAEVPDDLFGTIIDINLTIIFHLCKYALPHLARAPGASIVNLSSGAPF